MILIRFDTISSRLELILKTQICFPLKQLAHDKSRFLVVHEQSNGDTGAFLLTIRVKCVFARVSSCDNNACFF